MTVKTMTIRAVGNTIRYGRVTERDVEFVTLKSEEFHVTLSVNESGQLVLQSVSGLLLIAPAAQGKTLVFTQPFKKESQE